MLLGWIQNCYHSIILQDITMKIVPLCSVNWVPPLEPGMQVFSFNKALDCLRILFLSWPAIQAVHASSQKIHAEKGQLWWKKSCYQSEIKFIWWYFVYLTQRYQIYVSIGDIDRMRQFSHVHLNNILAIIINIPPRPQFHDCLFSFGLRQFSCWFKDMEIFSHDSYCWNHPGIIRMNMIACRIK